jgi:HD superfamily phosphohydrolase
MAHIVNSFAFEASKNMVSNDIRKNKKKIINDPVHGFVNIPSDFIYDIIEHPYFQRLRRIKQLGLTDYVYPGATHSRFQHTIGALHLMMLAIESLRYKGIKITEEEEEAVLTAILLHDIGHGPFSHALEESIISGISHEFLSQLLMKDLNKIFSNRLDLAIEIFNDRYSKKFLHQLVSSQLDMDRLDYIKRDSFFTGVTEGTIGTDRIIKMLNVADDALVIEKKGIYSVEKFLISRRLMYWQVYFHKTVIASENLMVKMLQRAKQVAYLYPELFATPALSYFLHNHINSESLLRNPEETIYHFLKLDDADIIVSAKEWAGSKDKVLSILAKNLINRNLPRVIISDQQTDIAVLEKISAQIQNSYKVNKNDTAYFLFQGVISNNAFSSREDMIQILLNNNETKNISEISDILNVPYLQKPEKKYFLCYPKDCGV